MEEPIVNVGIMSARRIKFELLSPYILYQDMPLGMQEVVLSEGKIYLNGQNQGSEFILKAPDIHSSSFKLYNVTIGINFHWEQRGDQTFIGNLKFIIETDHLGDSRITAINEVPMETYLESVISSEMSATSSLSLLYAHAIISRSWILYQLRNKAHTTRYQSNCITDERRIFWQDREDHARFDVCADDHCQRYEGITQISSSNVVKAVRETHGSVLMSDGELCDARFSKCCGGITEKFSTCWEDKDYTYLRHVRDSDDETDMPDLTREDNARKWILSSPESFCNVTDESILDQALKGYDRRTTDFFRWKVELDQSTLSVLARGKTTVNFGTVTDIIPIKRSSSGRLEEIKIVGTERSCIIGKELEIRYAFSNSHLLSSAFVVDKEVRDNKLYFVFHGAGWGHGVGLCQIGAAVMGAKGYDYKQILQHYYPGSEITKLY